MFLFRHIDFITLQFFFFSRLLLHFVLCQFVLLIFAFVWIHFCCIFREHAFRIAEMIMQFCSTNMQFELEQIYHTDSGDKAIIISQCARYHGSRSKQMYVGHENEHILIHLFDCCSIYFY